MLFAVLVRSSAPLAAGEYMGPSDRCLARSRLLQKDDARRPAQTLAEGARALLTTRLPRCGGVFFYHLGKTGGHSLECYLGAQPQWACCYRSSCGCTHTLPIRSSMQLISALMAFAVALTSPVTWFPYRSRALHSVPLLVGTNSHGRNRRALPASRATPVASGWLAPANDPWRAVSVEKGLSNTHTQTQTHASRITVRPLLSK